MKKVFIIQQVIPDYRTPVFHRLNTIAGYEIIIIAAENPKGWEFVDNINFVTKNESLGFRAIFLKQKKIFGIKFSYFPDLPKYILKEKPEVIIMQNMYLPGSILSLLTIFAIKISRAKLILWTIPFEEEKIKTFKKFVKKLLFSFVDAFLLYTESGIPIIESYGINKNKIFVACNSIDTDKIFEIKQLILSENSLIAINEHKIIFIGRLVPWKKIDFLIKALALVKKQLPDVELLIIGDGRERPELEKLARDLKILDSVHFLGSIRDDRVKAKYLLSSAVFVLPGMGGLSINEAMCYGLPIVCCEADGTEKQLVFDSFNGYIFRENDINDLAEKILKIITDRELREKMSKNSLKIIQDKVNINTMILGFKQAIEYVCYN